MVNEQSHEYVILTSNCHKVGTRGKSYEENVLDHIRLALSFKFHRHLSLTHARPLSLFCQFTLPECSAILRPLVCDKTNDDQCDDGYTSKDRETNREDTEFLTRQLE